MSMKLEHYKVWKEGHTGGMQFKATDSHAAASHYANTTTMRATEKLCVQKVGSDEVETFAFKFSFGGGVEVMKQ